MTQETVTHLLAITYPSRLMLAKGKYLIPTCSYGLTANIYYILENAGSPQIGPANISLSMKAAFPEFFRIYVNCFFHQKWEKDEMELLDKTDILDGFKSCPNKENWRRREASGLKSLPTKKIGEGQDKCFPLLKLSSCREER